MPSNVNLILSNRRTGTTITITRRLIDYSISWTDDANVPHSASGTLTFPDIATHPALDPAMVQADIEALLYKWGRIVVGIDPA